MFPHVFGHVFRLVPCVVGVGHARSVSVSQRFDELVNSAIFVMRDFVEDETYGCYVLIVGANSVQENWESTLLFVHDDFEHVLRQSLFH